MIFTTAEISTIKVKYKVIKSCLSEKGKRLWAAVEVNSYGRGGFNAVCLATGLSSATISKGLKELANDSFSEKDRIRKSGGGRKKLSQIQSNLVPDLEQLIEPTTRGDPESHLKWTCKSTRNLAKSLNQKGYRISHTTVASLLRKLNYSLQSNKKTLEGSSHADRDGQFNYINSSVTIMNNLKQPTISVDTKKKENIGNYKNNGREFCKKGNPLKVQGHDFPDKRLGKVVPYGIYDIGKNKGWVSVGISSDTAEFAVNSIRTWWYKMGLLLYPAAKELLITADCGGSNGYKVRLWKYELQRFATESDLRIHVRHFPPGTSKWNKIEHRLFSYISKNWRGQPLLTREIVVNLIGNTKTNKGLEVKAVLDKSNYIKGKKISKDEFNSIKIKGDEFHPEWNYTILPQKTLTL